MDITTKKIMLNCFTILLVLMISMVVYKVIFNNYSITGAIVNSLFIILGYGITYLVLSHDINKFKRWSTQAIEYSTEAIGHVSDISLSSTRENGRNTVILSATYDNHEITFSGINPELQFKYKVGDDIKIRVHPNDPQRFVLDDLK